jgi:hypothetical protein
MFFMGLLSEASSDKSSYYHEDLGPGADFSLAALKIAARVSRLPWRGHPARELLRGRDARTTSINCHGFFAALAAS